MRQLVAGVFIRLWLQLPASKCDFDYKEPYPGFEGYPAEKSPYSRDPPPYIFTGQFLTLIRTPPVSSTTLLPYLTGGKPTPAPGTCMSSTRRTNLGCYCYAIGQRSTPFGDSDRYIDVDPAAGTLIYKKIPPASLVSQVYRVVGKEANGSVHKVYQVFRDDLGTHNDTVD
ncbi:hypothetical protein RvY_05103 [Ramazzottius varieornatus]|uniref:Uncharacterized protein n=1 Tax=Ramazzottius varieornatus TaxID=947166 RepID=A0A1D1UTW0_RAMVA|nr:hypothetical protein RvY_05103 [Ramazzottius varieornatus]